MDETRAEPVGVALVGLGAIGLGAHLPALLRHSGVRVHALVDPDPARRAEAARQAGDGIATFDDMAPVLADPRIRAVVLATPPWVTPAATVRAARAGRYVLAEKPVATGTTAARVYETLAPGERRRVQVGLTYRHDPAIQRLRTWVTSDRLGGPLLVRAHIFDERREPGESAHNERIRATLDHGMPVVHEGAHLFDWLATVLGSGPVSVDDAWALRTEPGLPSPNLTGARLTYPGGHVATVEFGWLTDALPRCELSVLGSRGHAVLDCATFGLELATASGVEAAEFPGERTARCFDRQLERFTALVAGERGTPEPDLDDGLAALATCERIADAALGKVEAV